MLCLVSLSNFVKEYLSYLNFRVIEIFNKIGRKMSKIENWSYAMIFNLSCVKHYYNIYILIMSHNYYTLNKIIILTINVKCYSYWNALKKFCNCIFRNENKIIRNFHDNFMNSKFTQHFDNLMDLMQ